jgi:hypothetical protein
VPPIDRSSPPPKCDKRFLFRGLIRRPRPQRALSFRVRGAEHIKLYARALKGLEYVEAFEAGDDVEPEHLSISTITAELLSMTVYTASCRAFASGDMVMRLSDNEMSQLGREALDALHFISPTYQRSNLAAWEIALKEGAAHQSNFQEAIAMYKSCDRVGMDGTIHERPDRYYGLPMCELTDGHLMVFSAAVKFISEAVRSPDG